MLSAAVPFSCWCAIARASAWNGVCWLLVVCVNFPAARITFARIGSTLARRRLNAARPAGVHMDAGVFTRAILPALELFLAIRTPVGGTAALRELFDGFAANAAGLARALV